MRVGLFVVFGLVVGCAEPADEPQQRRDAGSRPFVLGTIDGGSADAGVERSPRDGGPPTFDGGDQGFDAGLIIDEPFDGGGELSDAGCSCALKIAHPDQPGLFIAGVTIGCGASVCSIGGALDFGCDALGVPMLPDCPTQRSCLCTLSPGHRMRCGTSSCSGPTAMQTGYVCSASGQLSGPMTCP